MKGVSRRLADACWPFSALHSRPRPHPHPHPHLRPGGRHRRPFPQSRLSPGRVAPVRVVVLLQGRWAWMLSGRPSVWQSRIYLRERGILGGRARKRTQLNPRENCTRAEGTSRESKRLWRTRHRRQRWHGRRRRLWRRRLKASSSGGNSGSSGRRKGMNRRKRKRRRRRRRSLRRPATLTARSPTIRVAPKAVMLRCAPMTGVWPLPPVVAVPPMSLTPRHSRMTSAPSRRTRPFYCLSALMEKPRCSMTHCMHRRH